MHLASADIWKIRPEAKLKYDEKFFQLKPINGYITGEQAKNLFLMSGLPPQILAHIWSLADRDADGKMDCSEFAVAMHLIEMKLKGFEIPKTLPPSMAVPAAAIIPNVPAYRPPVPIGAHTHIHWCAKIKDEVEKLAYQLNEEAERTERPIRRLSKVLYGGTCADMQVDVMGECE
ncbi:intersectin-1 [Trichonephila clavipes]|nr:intersectin-1 [Trichonephila clavipes]